MDLLWEVQSIPFGDIILGFFLLFFFVCVGGIERHPSELEICVAVLESLSLLLSPSNDTRV